MSESGLVKEVWADVLREGIQGVPGFVVVGSVVNEQRWGFIVETVKTRQTAEGLSVYVWGTVGEARPDDPEGLSTWGARIAETEMLRIGRELPFGAARVVVCTMIEVGVQAGGKRRLYAEFMDPMLLTALMEQRRLSREMLRMQPKLERSLGEGEAP